jgi:Ankyrin repeats (3 copies)
MNRYEVLIWGGVLLLLGLGVVVFIQKPWEQSRDIIEAVVRNDAEFVRRWSGDVNRVIEGEHLLDVATGPKGGSDVVRELLKKGANPNGDGLGYSPLMNAASWVDVESVKMLLDAGADVHFMRDGKRAVDVIGRGGGGQDRIRELLLKKQ